MKYSIRYNLKPNATKAEDKRHYISVRISWAGIRAEALTGLKVLPDYWDIEEQRVRSAYRYKGETGASVNKQLAELTAYLDQQFTRWHTDHHTPTRHEVRQTLATYFGTSTAAAIGADLFEAYDTFTRMMSEQNGWTSGTCTKYRTIRAHLSNYSQRLTFEDLTEEGLQGFMRHLLRSGLRNVTVAKDIDLLRGFLRWAYKRGYTKNKAFETFRPKLKGTDGNLKEVIYLEWDELMTLYHFDFGERHPGLAQVRDVFCFCCFTGLRYSDAAKLRTSDIHGSYISVVTQKTSDGLRIELNDFSRAILDRYQDYQTAKHNRTHKALPVISNQKMNDYLKDIGRLIGLDTPIRIVYYVGAERIEEVHPKHELLTTHCARRTFVVNALRLGIPAEVIMKWTGHSDFKSMRPYVKIVDELKEQEMSKFNLLSQKFTEKG